MGPVLTFNIPKDVTVLRPSKPNDPYSLEYNAGNMDILSLGEEGLTTILYSFVYGPKGETQRI